MHFPGAVGIGGGSFCSACVRGGGGFLYINLQKTNKQTKILAFRMIAINTKHIKLRRQEVLASCTKKP